MRPVIRLNQNCIINFLILEISCTAIKYFLVQAIPGGYVYNSIANVFVSLLLILVLLPALAAAFKENPTSVGLMMLGFVLIISSQMLIFPENASAILSNLVKMAGMSLGCLITANTLTEYEIFYYKLVKVSKIIICFAKVLRAAIDGRKRGHSFDYGRRKGGIPRLRSIIPCR